MSFLQETDNICELCDKISSLFTLVQTLFAYEMARRLYIEWQTLQLLKDIESISSLLIILWKHKTQLLAGEISITMTKVFHCVIFFALSRDLDRSFGNQLELRMILKATSGVQFLHWGF